MRQSKLKDEKKSQKMPVLARTSTEVHSS